MEKKKQAEVEEQESGLEREFKDCTVAEVGDTLENARNKLIFLADIVSTSETLELTEDGKDGLYWMLHDIADEIDRAISA